MDIIYIIALVPLFFLGGIFLYLLLRKNDFEQRLALYRPLRSLPPQRQEYMKGVGRYVRYASIFLGVFFTLPIVAIFSSLFIDTKSTFVFLLFTLAIGVESLAIYAFFYIFKRNAKAQQMLLEQMTDDDFQQLLSIQKELIFINRYAPPFVFCKDKLYLFSFFSIKEIDPTEVEKVSWFSSKGGNRTVLIKAKGRSMITVPANVYGHFAAILKRYSPNADIEI